MHYGIAKGNYIICDTVIIIIIGSMNSWATLTWTMDKEIHYNNYNGGVRVYHIAQYLLTLLINDQMPTI